jgi:hypothetical protein
MSNTNPVVPAIEAVAVAVAVASAFPASEVNELCSRVKVWSGLEHKADKAAQTVVDLLFANKVVPRMLLATDPLCDKPLYSAMWQALIDGKPVTMQKLITFKGKLPNIPYDPANKIAFNAESKRRAINAIGANMGDLRKKLETRIAEVNAAKAEADAKIEAAKIEAETLKAAAEAAKAAEAHAKAEVKADKAAAAALKAPVADQAKAAAEAAEAKAAADAAADKAAQEAAKAAAAKAAQEAAMQLVLANKSQTTKEARKASLIAAWTHQKKTIQDATDPGFDAAKIIKMLDAMIAELVVIQK